MIKQTWWRALSTLIVWLLVTQAGAPFAGAQPEALQVIIMQPGEGETYYTGSDGPRTLVPILGRVSSGSFDPQQLEIQLDLLQDGKLIGREIGVANAYGAFGFRIMINAQGSGELGTPEMNCFYCHEVARLTLPGGPSVVRVTAVEPTGRKAVAERRVTLDRALLATVTVQVKVEGDSAASIPGLLITATTRVYDWRARKFSALTDTQGQAVMQIEALTQAPTRYLFSVAPILVDSALYQTRAPVEVVLPAGARSASPIKLTVEAQLGQIAGSVAQAGKLPDGPLTIRAVELLHGRSFAAPVAEGKFVFDGLPIAAYLVGADPDQAAALGGRTAAVRLDLAAQPQAACTLELAPLTGRSARGAIRDASGPVIPFAWIEAGDKGLVAPASLVSGVFALYGLPDGARTLRVSAPGYWSRTVPARAGLDVKLKPRPDTRILPWGAGKLVIPDKTNASASGDRIVLRQGWLWGTGDRPLTIDTPESRITVQGGSFALEYLPGESAWLYVLSGEAAVSARGEPDIAVRSGEMCAFAGKGIARPLPVPFDEVALRLLQTQRPLPVQFETEPGIWPRIQELLAGIGM